LFAVVSSLFFSSLFELWRHCTTPKTIDMIAKRNDRTVIKGRYLLKDKKASLLRQAELFIGVFGEVGSFVFTDLCDFLRFFRRFFEVFAFIILVILTQDLILFHI